MEPQFRLIVLADDWGRHPSSCQHLVRQLLGRHPTIWVNTIGMRRPRLSRDDAKKVERRLRAWLPVRSGGRPAAPANLTVVSPFMWPSFRRAWERRLNARLIDRAVRPLLQPRGTANPPRQIVITTLPIAATLAGRLLAAGWVYYCVDDHSLWPGLDGRLMQELEVKLLEHSDCIVAASTVLQQRLSARGFPSTLLTHGVDIAHWRSGDVTGGSCPPELPAWWNRLQRPIALFWGLVDRRLDVAWLRALQDPRNGFGGSLVLLGPRQAHDPAITSLDRVVLSGAVPFAALPRFAAAADVLVMPYADLPVTQAMQPLKLKEYLATGKPVVVRSLPATREWADACDVVETAEDFVRAVSNRAAQRTPTQQRVARKRLVNESWESKAAAFEQHLLACAASKSARAPTTRLSRAG